jgi:AraC family transcriptional regulator
MSLATTVVVLHRGRTRGAAPHVAPLSIHTTLRGREVYLTAQGRHAVEPGRLLILNEGQTARTMTSDDQAVDSLSVLFDRSLATNVLRSLTQSPERLLDDPLGDGFTGEPIEFVERAYPVEPRTARLLGALAREGGAAREGREEIVHALLERLLVLHRGLRAEVALVPALRAATRLEVFRRLCRARDFLDASLDRPVSLVALSRVACIAPHRLLRLYSATFGETPHRYAVRRRMERAAQLLAGSDLRVDEVARAVGFESAGSFSTRFRRLRGASPGAFRRRGEKGKIEES